MWTVFIKPFEAVCTIMRVQIASEKFNEDRILRREGTFANLNRHSRVTFELLNLQILGS